jgi:hypothetical protein
VREIIGKTTGWRPYLTVFATDWRNDPLGARQFLDVKRDIVRQASQIGHSLIYHCDEWQHENAAPML